jgi:hypothetical protein
MYVKLAVKGAWRVMEREIHFENKIFSTQMVNLQHMMPIASLI